MNPLPAAAHVAALVPHPHLTPLLLTVSGAALAQTRVQRQHSLDGAFETKGERDGRAIVTAIHWYARGNALSLAAVECWCPFSRLLRTPLMLPPRLVDHLAPTRIPVVVVTENTQLRGVRVLVALRLVLSDL